MDNSRLTTQVRPTLGHLPDRSRSLSYILDPRRINDYVVSWEPIVVVSKIVINPIAVVVERKTDLPACNWRLASKSRRSVFIDPVRLIGIVLSLLISVPSAAPIIVVEISP